MERLDRTATAIRFGVFEIDPRSGELRKSGIRIPLQEQPFQLLLALLEHPGEPVTREELKRRIWPEQSFGDFDHAVNVAVAKLRAALGDSAESPRYVETLHRRGYRFLVPIFPPATPSPSKHNQWISNRGFPALIVIGIVLLAAGLTIRKWPSRGNAPDLQSISIRRLTQSGDVGVSAAISPDGRYVAFVRAHGYSSAAWLLQIETNTEAQMPETEGSLILGLTFTPDGNYLYMMRNDQADPMTHHLFRIPILGGRPQHLLAGVDTPVSFSPDGHDFVYTRDVPKREAVELRTASADGTNDHLITTINGLSEFFASGGAAWSPDGKTICFPVEQVGRENRWAIEMISVADGSSRELFSSHSFIGRPVWQPDGKSLIVALADATSRTQLWTVSFPEGRMRRLTNGLTDYGYRPDATRDGKTVATTAGTFYDSSLWSVPRDNPSKAKLIHPNREMFQVANSPDGRIVGTALDGTPWVMDADGSHLATFTNAHDAYGIRACGEFVVLLTTVNLIRVIPDGSNPTELATGALSSADCSSDGKFVYYLDTRQPAKILRVSLEGGTPAEVSRVLGENTLGQFSVSRDGRLLAYCYEEIVPQPMARLAVVPTSGGPPVKTFEGAIIGLVRWSPDSENLDYVDRRSGASNIWEQPLAGGAPKQLTQFTGAGGEITDFDWSADGSIVLLLRSQYRSDVVLISNFR